MDAPGFWLGIAIAGLHWWQFDRVCKNLGEHLAAGRVVKLAARRWGMTFLLGMVCTQGLRVDSGSFLTGFLLASFTARAVALLRHLTNPDVNRAG